MSRFRTALRHRQRGIALVMVLWVLILLGLVAASFLRETRLGTNLARNITENAKAEALAEAGIQRAMVGLLDPDPVTRWRADGTAYDFALGDGMVVVRIEDEGGKVDLNRAPASILLALLEAAGVDSESARALADAIYDFRDADHERRAAGAEDADYLAAGLEAGAKDAPFDDTEELMQVLGMTREIHVAISPYVTVYSRRGGRINLLTAPEFVLRAIPNLKPEQLEKILADRVDDTRLGRARADVVTVRAEAVTRGGGAFIREAVLRPSGESQQPFTIVDWRQVWRSVPDLGEAGTAEQ
jgi:general secretion pathway protein K